MELTKEELVILIAANQKLDSLLKKFEFVGITLSIDAIGDILGVEAIIHNHSKYANREDRRSFYQFRKTLYDYGKTPEEKYMLLTES